MMISPQSKQNVGRTFPFYYVSSAPGRTSFLHSGVLLILFLISFSNAFAQTRIGLHVTQEELNIWRERCKTVPYLSKTGPYKKANDVSSNSPGDWDRILSNANSFVSRPSADRFVGYTGGGCVPRWSAEPGTRGEKMKDAAFAFLITSDQKYLNAVRNELMAQAGEPLTDFTKSSRWCVGVMNDVNPGFFIAEWLTRLLVSYDYIRSSISSTDRQRLDTWFRNAAFFFQREIDTPLSRVYVNRNNGNYNLTDYAINSGVSRLDKISHYGGRKIPNLAKWYNNRRGSMVRFYTLVGAQQNIGQLKNSGKLYIKEWLKFSTFPDGIIGDFERWAGSFPDLGWGYAAYCVGQAVDIADHLARAGDMELYKYTTSEGKFGTQGGSKSIHLTIKNLLSYLDGSVKRYATTNSSQVGNSFYLIDGSKDSWQVVSDVWVAQANVYFKDNSIRDIYLRKKSGTKPYPSRQASAGPNNAWSGTGGIYPGKLLMFGQMEGKVWPYYSGSGDAPIKAPTPANKSTNSDAKTTITVHAQGNSVGGTYAHFRILVNGMPTTAEAYSNSSWKSYTFTVNTALKDISSVMVHFTNNAIINGQDRDLYVKYIVVGGQQIDSRASNVTYDRGALDGKDVIAASSTYNIIKGSVAMPWSGALIYKLSNTTTPPAQDTAPPAEDTAPPSEDNGSNAKITVNAKGSTAGNIYAHFRVLVNGKAIGSAYTSNSYKNYTFTANVSASNIRTVTVHYDNDAFISGRDRNLYVDHIIVNNNKISSTASNVKYDRGRIDGSNVIEGRVLLSWEGALVFNVSNASARKDFDANPEIGAASLDFTMSPNPNPGIFTVSMNVGEESDVAISIINLVGNTVYEKAFTASGAVNEQISLPSLPSGIYLLKVKSNNELVTKKFVKE